MEGMEEEEGGATPPLEPRRQELLAAATREGDTYAAAVFIDMNIEGRRENFLQPAPPSGAPADCAIVSSAGGAAIAASFNVLTSHSIMGLTSVVAGAAAAAVSTLNTAAGGGAARGG